MKENPTNGLCLGFVSCAHFPLTLPSSAVGPGVFSSQKQRPESEFLHPRRSLKSHLKIQNSKPPSAWERVYLRWRGGFFGSPDLSTIVLTCPGPQSGGLEILCEKQSWGAGSSHEYIHLVLTVCQASNQSQLTSAAL